MRDPREDGSNPFDLKMKRTGSKPVRFFWSPPLELRRPLSVNLNVDLAAVVPRGLRHPDRSTSLISAGSPGWYAGDWK